MEILYTLCDLDETLYPSDTGLWEATAQRITHYMHTRLGIPADLVEAQREHYFRTYGTSLRGLEIHHHVDPRDFLDFVHDLPIQDYLQPDPELKALLGSFPGERLIVTNASRAHAERVIRALDLDGSFSRIIDILDMEPFCKPMRGAFERVLALVGDPEPGHYLLLDDSPRNVRAAVEMGMTGILVSQREEMVERSYRIATLHGVMPVLEAIAEGSRP